jgi:agmatinase
MYQKASHPMNFLGLEPPLSDFANAKVLVWPVPFEKTVSYGSGTSEGPAAIIEASRYIELYDEDFGGETAQIGIHTLPAINTDYEPDEMIPLLEQRATELIATNKFICMLGGEHSISAPVVRAMFKKYPRLSVMQIDAHADLRNSYEGTPLSHASTMRRIVEVCPAVQVGIRSISKEEVLAVPTLNTQIYYAKDITGRSEWVERAVNSLTEDVYLTIDIDGLDPSLVQSTGTPEPGGLQWYEVLNLIRHLARSRNIVGMDLVELCRPKGNNAASILAAKLIYKTLGSVFEREIPNIHKESKA